MICASCQQPIEPGQLYHYALRATPEVEGGTVRALVDLDLPVHEYPCPARMEIVNGRAWIHTARGWLCQRPHRDDPRPATSTHGY